MPNRNLTVNQAAAHIGVSRERVYQRIRDGSLSVILMKDTVGADMRDKYLIPWEAAEKARLERVAEGGAPKGGRPSRKKAKAKPTGWGEVFKNRRHS